MNRYSSVLVLAALACAAGLRAQPASPDSAAALTRLLDRITVQEAEFMRDVRSRTPLLETYIQETPPPGSEYQPNRDHYFLGRLSFTPDLKYTPIVTRSEPPRGSRFLLFKNRSVLFVATGFAQMMFIDTSGFDRKNYNFEYVRREFLGDIRCLVFDVAPHDQETGGRFVGRIWVEDREFRVVRFNGTYTGSTAAGCAT